MSAPPILDPVISRAVSRLGYMPQLDSLRAIAVFGVFIEHFMRPDDPVRRFAPWGWLGVRMFFVLSGFLITDLLLAKRNAIDAGTASMENVFRQFYLRRFLRLSPAYYANLLFASVFLIAARPYIIFFLFYSQNFLFAAQPLVYSNVMAHFWTLAVEEQFYLTWPLIIVMTPRSLMIRVISIFVCGGVLFRVTGLALGLSPLSVEMMMPAHLDTLAMGGLLAALRYQPPLRIPLPRIGLLIGAPCLAVYILCERLSLLDARILMVFGESVGGLFFLWLIYRASIGFEGWWGWLLRRRALVYLGAISYGLYVYHFNVPGMLREKLLRGWGLAWIDKTWLGFVIYSLTSILIASLSWYAFEAVIKRLTVSQAAPDSPCPRLEPKYQ